jgi:spermidine/putrescine transport system ATP-binding protein
MVARSAITDFVEVRNASKAFDTPEGGTVQALDQVSLSVRDNEFLTLLGPSGCGKTTLLRTISGFEQLDEGEILIDGQFVSNVPPNHRPVNTVFQNYALFPHMSVDHNVGYSLDVAAVQKKDRDRRVAKALEVVGLSGLSQRRPKQLSGGQQQRVALARAIISQPKLLLLDEPLSALDRNLRQSMRLELKNLQHELGISFIFVTHDQEEALTMSNRIVVMDEGRIQQVGTPTEVYDHPDNSFVAHFLGESNLLPGQVHSQDHSGTRVKTDFGLIITVSHCDARVGSRVTVMIRPEHLQLAATPSSAASSKDHPALQISGTLQQTMFVGSDFQLIFELSGGGIMRASVRDTERASISALVDGQDIKFTYSPLTPHVICEP